MMTVENGDKDTNVSFLNLFHPLDRSNWTNEVKALDT